MSPADRKRPRQKLAGPKRVERKRAAQPRSTAPQPARQQAARQQAARQQDGTRVLDGRDRFAAALRTRPWQRQRRRILLGLLITALVAATAIVLLLTLPMFKVSTIDVTGTGYVSSAQVEEAASPELGGSILTADASGVQERVEKIPGVRTAQVRRSWPNTLEITVTEREAVAQVTGAKAGVVDAEGVTLPAAAAKGQELMTLQVAADAKDPAATEKALLSALSSMPPQIREMTTTMTASTPSNITLSITADGQKKTVVWGTDEDAELKGRVVSALLSQPGAVIDVSAPQAPTVRE